MRQPVSFIRLVVVHSGEDKLNIRERLENNGHKRPSLPSITAESVLILGFPFVPWGPPFFQQLLQISKGWYPVCSQSSGPTVSETPN